MRQAIDTTAGPGRNCCTAWPTRLAQAAADLPAGHGAGRRSDVMRLKRLVTYPYSGYPLSGAKVTMRASRHGVGAVPWPDTPRAAMHGAAGSELSGQAVLT